MALELLRLLHRAGEWRGVLDPLSYFSRCNSQTHSRTQSNFLNISPIPAAVAPATAARAGAARAGSAMRMILRFS